MNNNITINRENLSFKILYFFRQGFFNNFIQVIKQKSRTNKKIIVKKNK